MTDRPETPPMTAALAGSFDWTGRSGRGTFLVVCVAFPLVFGVGIALGWNHVAPVPFFAAMGLLFFVLLGQLRRRIRDAGWRGGWMWACLVPYLGLIPQVILMFRRSTDAVRTGENATVRRLGWSVGLIAALLLVARGFWWAPYWIPAGSMKPALHVGDYIFVRTSGAMPERGDIVVFRHPVQGQDFVKRVIGLPRDTVQMRGGVVVLNGVAVPQADAGLFTEVFDRQGPHGLLPRCMNGPVGQGEPCEKRALRETLPSGRSYTVLDIAETHLDNTPLFTVPEGHLFMLGDNRDNSADSRLARVARGMGFVPVENVKGRVTRVAMSLTGDLARTFRGIE